MIIKTIIATASAALLAGCALFYENAGMRVRAGSVTAPIEVSEPTSSTNIRLLFFLDGVDLYATKGSAVKMKYWTANGGNWLSGSSTQSVEVVVTPRRTNDLSGAAGAVR